MWSYKHVEYAYLLQYFYIFFFNFILFATIYTYYISGDFVTGDVWLVFIGTSISSIGKAENGLAVVKTGLDFCARGFHRSPLATARGVCAQYTVKVFISQECAFTVIYILLFRMGFGQGCVGCNNIYFYLVCGL